MKNCAFDCYDCPFSVAKFCPDGGIDDVCNYSERAIAFAKNNFIQSISGLNSFTIGDIILSDDISVFKNIQNIDYIFKCKNTYFDMLKVKFVNDLNSPYQFIE